MALSAPTASVPVTLVEPASKSRLTKVAAATVIGSAIEAFDFLAYGTAADRPPGRAHRGATTAAHSPPNRCCSGYSKSPFSPDNLQKADVQDEPFNRPPPI